MPAGIAPGVNVTTLAVDNGANLGLTIAQPFNENQPANDGPIVASSGQITIGSGATLNINYGSFIASSPSDPAKFVLLQAPNAADLDVDLSALQANFNAQSSFLYSGMLDLEASGSATGNNQLVLTPTQKCAAEIVGDLNCTASNSVGNWIRQENVRHRQWGLRQRQYPWCSGYFGGRGRHRCCSRVRRSIRKIYSQFAPDVTGATRAIAISLTDSASGPVGARQRTLRMYANQDGDITLWGQEFAQDLSADSSAAAYGYRDTGFGFVVGCRWR